MLNGKAWPKALRGLRMVAEALLEPVASRGGQGGGLVPRGPGQLWGPGPSCIFFYRKSMGDPGF